jgi:two-component system, sensor histidine kinase
MATSESNNAPDAGENSSLNAPLPSILIVDDSHDAANILGSLFGAHGYPIQVAYDWATALEAARTYLPDVILLDLGMPELDGIHLARFFREDEQLKDKVLIALTGYADEMHRTQCEAAGFDYFFPKPATWADLKSTIDRLWSKRCEREKGAGSDARPPLERPAK